MSSSPRLSSLLTSLALAALAACGGKGAAHPAQHAVTLTEAGIAGITATTPVDDATLAGLVAGAEIRPDGAEIREVWRGGERLFYVVLVTAGHPELGPFNVHVTSPSVVAPHGWRAGAPLASTDGLDSCVCWGEDMRVCFGNGSHLAVALDHAGCDGVPEVGAIAGKPVTKLVWNPLPWPDTVSLPGDEGSAD